MANPVSEDSAQVPNNATHDEPVAVALNGQINPLGAGGSESSVMSIVKHVGPRAQEVRLRFIAQPQFVEPLLSVAPKGVEAIEWPLPMSAPIRDDVQGKPWVQIRNGLGPVAPAFDYVVWLRRMMQSRKTLPTADECDALLARQRIDVVHFGWPTTFPTRLPFIYEPHDLQHRHYPEFFPVNVRRWREDMYGNACRDATFIVCGTWWTKHDIMRQYDVPCEKVAVIPRASIKASQRISPEREAEIAKVLNLPEEFAYYSAMTFEHKNHLRLIAALQHLRDNVGVRVTLLMTGRRIEPVYGRIAAAIDEAGLQDQVRFLGTVSEEELTVIYRRALLMVFPSLFEGLSQSLLEGLSAGLPIVAAHQSSIPETCGSAGVYFDGLDEQSIAKSLAEALTDRDRLTRMAKAAREEMQRFDWEPAAQTFVAVYRKAAGRTLTDEQTDLLAKSTRMNQ